MKPVRVRRRTNSTKVAAAVVALVVTLIKAMLPLRQPYFSKIYGVIWRLTGIRDTILGGPHNKDDNVLGSI